MHTGDVIKGKHAAPWNGKTDAKMQSGINKKQGFIFRLYQEKNEAF